MKVLLIILFLFLTSCLFAQRAEKSKHMGLHASPLIWIEEGQGQFNGIVIQGYYGVFVKEKVSVGIEPYYAAFGSKVLGTNGFTRYYLKRDRGQLFIEGSLGFAALINEGPEFYPLFDTSIGTGGGYALGKLAIEVKLEYRYWVVLSETGSGGSMVPSIGLMYYLSR